MPDAPTPAAPSATPAAPEATATPAAPEATATRPAEGAAPATAPEAPPEKPKEPPLSPRAAALMKQEAQLRKREADLKKLEAELTTSKTEAEKRAALKKENALKWLEAEGLDYAALTELALNDGKPPPQKVVDERIAAAEARVAELAAKLEAKEKEAAQKEADALEAGFWQEGRTALEAKPDAFALTLDHPDGWDTVQALVREHAKTTGEVLSVEAAALKVEAALEAQQAAIWKSERVRAKLAPVLGATAPAPKPASPQAASDSGPSRAARTLTNSQAAVVPTAPRRPTTRDERIALAAAAMRAKK